MDANTKRYLKGMPREEKLDHLVDQVDDWDMDSLIDWVKEELRERYDAMGDLDLDEEYYLSFEDDVNSEVDDMLEAEKEEPDEQSECQCPSLFLMGHDAGCPEIKKRS